MFEFMFFDHELRLQFIDFAHEHGIECHALEDNLGMIAAVPEDIPDAVCDALDAHYEALMERQAALIDDADGDAAHQAAGVCVTLKDGQHYMIRLDPKLANQLLSAFTLEETQALVQAIADNLETPDNRPICKR